MSLFDDIFTTTHKDINKIMDDIKNTSLFSWSEDTLGSLFLSNLAVDVIYSCPSCKKHFGMESRFVEPGRTVKCLYCDANMTFPKEDNSKEKGEKGEEKKPEKRGQ